MKCTLYFHGTEYIRINLLIVVESARVEICLTLYYMQHVHIISETLI